MAETLFELWGKRNPEFETRYEDKIIKTFCDYGKGTTGYQESRGKIFGAGYEIYIMAFFIGLYFDRKRPMIDDQTKRKGFGQPLQYWGNQENRKFRKSYSGIREYMFMACVARTKVDFLEVDKGTITPRKAVDLLIQTMEEYANFGFDYMEDKLIDNADYFFRNSAFLDTFLSFLKDKEEGTDDVEIESLD